MTDVFGWPVVDQFLGRVDDLALLERWWDSPSKEPINLYGRRRVGKSWLVRRFAHGKPACLLVASTSSQGAQLRGFAERLEPLLGFRADITDVAALFRVLLRAARQSKLLVVVDEFPWLLPGTEKGDAQILSSVGAVLEDERDASQLKLILCGSRIGPMGAMLGERRPLHGRLQPVQLRPMAFEQASLFMPSLSLLERFERFAITGGMPRYLAELSSGDVRTTVSARVLDRDGPLFDEARAVLEPQLRDSRNYFAIASALASGDKEQAEIIAATSLSASVVSKYLQTLAGLGIVSRATPIGASPDSRAGRWRLEDPFFRFWFRFVFPYQDDLESGLQAGDLFDTDVAPNLADHVAPQFEHWCRHWTRNSYGTAVSTVGSWWGNALNELRRRGQRTTEQVDIVAMSRNRVTLVGATSPGAPPRPTPTCSPNSRPTRSQRCSRQACGSPRTTPR